MEALIVWLGQTRNPTEPDLHLLDPRVFLIIPGLTDYGVVT